MHVETVWSGVKYDHILFHFADTANSRLKHFLIEDSLLRMHHLIVTLLQFAIDIYVLYI